LKKLSELCWKTFVLSSIVVLCYSLGINEAFGQSVGVKVGDWASYDIKREGEPTVWISPFNRAEWVRVEVQDVSGTNVTLLEIVRLSDGAELNRTHNGNVDSRSVYLYIISANLSVGDEYFFLSRIDKLPINATVSRTYGNVVRDANQVTWSNTIPYFEDELHYIYEIFWDKNTGLLLDLKLESYFVGYENRSTSLFELRIAETNLWKMELSTLSIWQQIGLALAGLFVSTGISIAIFNRSLKSKRQGIGE